MVGSDKSKEALDMLREELRGSEMKMKAGMTQREMDGVMGGIVVNDGSGL